MNGNEARRHLRAGQQQNTQTGSRPDAVWQQFQRSVEPLAVAEGAQCDKQVRETSSPDSENVTFDKVLAVIDGDKITVGTPVVEGAKVDASVVKNGKGKKVIVFKYKPKKGYRRKQGHRQPYTKVTIGKISV